MSEYEETLDRMLLVLKNKNNVSDEELKDLKEHLLRTWHKKGNNENNSNENE